jgi:hypothetical protein
MQVHVGLDFDNTIVSYDGVFHRYAVELFDMPPEVPADKPSIKRYFWTFENAGGWEHWVELQGIVYGEKMAEAMPSPGLNHFLERCRSEGVRISIISHKTEYPTKGPRVSLWDAAWQWLEVHGFFEADGFGISKNDVFFEKERGLKLARIARQQCTHFVDDLPEVLEDDGFPERVGRLLYDPADRHHPCHSLVVKCRTWDEIHGTLVGHHA